MCEMTIVSGETVLLDKEDYDRFSLFRWATIGRGYVSRRGPRHHYKRETFYLHREILQAPRGVEVDHINRDKLDNRRGNLRLATRLQNCCNLGLKKNNTSGHPGVRILHGRWGSRITVNGSEIHLGSFDRFEDAVTARRAAEIKFFGTFAPVRAN